MFTSKKANNNRLVIFFQFIALSLAVVMVDVDMTAINLALPQIIENLSVSLNSAQWIINGYLIAAASCMILGGIIGDHYGHKKVFLIGLIFFALFSMLTGLANNDISIVIFRVFQGFCVAFTFPLAIALVSRIFPPNKLGFALSTLIAIAGISQSLGPTIGGFMVTVLNWRWLFFINIPLCIFSYFIIYYLTPTGEAHPNRKIPFIAAGILVAGLFLLLTSFNNVVFWGFSSLAVQLCFFFGIGLLVIFFYHRKQGGVFSYRHVTHEKY